MELYREILIKVLQQQEIKVVFPDLTFKANEIIKNESHRSLLKIKAIIQDDSLEDSECFMKIEEIVRI